MGLLKRFRASSSASNRGPVPDADFTTPPMPPPPIMTHSHMYATVSRASVADSMTPSTSASGMETPKSSKSFWKRKTKGKDKESYGLPYENTSPGPAPPLPQNQYQGERSRNSSFVHVPAPRRGLSQKDYRGREGSSTPKQEITPRGASQIQPQQRAMLGKLDFEGQRQGQGQGFNHIPEVYNRQTAPRTSSIPFGTSTTQQSQQPNGRPVTAIFLERPKSQAPTPTAEPAGRMSQEEMEHLASPEKGVVYTPNPRRMSRSSIHEEPGSPTPRKNTLPPQDLALRPKPSRASSTDNHNALSSRRPSANRRSSFIPLNPFRSRGSMNDLDQQMEDDGSFQVMSFRHVSGASDYQDPAPAPKVEVDTSPVNAFTPIPTTSAPSRPMSRAASLASLDDHISTAAKVSAGAFRKGVRRPSSTYIDNMDDNEDDDVPLGMLRYSGRESSSASLSSFRDGSKAPIQMRSPGRKPGQSMPTTPNRSRPSIPSSPNTIAMLNEDRIISHIRTKAMPLISPDEIHPNFPSPPHSPVGSPKQTSHPELPDTGYFAPATTTTTSRRTPPPVTDSPEFDFSTLDYPVSAFSTSPQASKIVKAPASEPVGNGNTMQGNSTSPQLNSKGSKLLDALVTQTSGLAVSIPSPAGGSTLSSAISPAPIKVRQETDKFDEELIIRSMAVYGEDIENEPPTPKVAIRQQSHSSLYNESMSSENSTIRSPLSERLGNLVGPRPMGKPSLVGLNTHKVDVGEDVKSPSSDATVSPVVAQTPRSSFARVTSQTQPLKGGSDSGGSSSSSSNSEDEMPPPPPPASTRPVNAPRSSFANAPPRPVSMFKPTTSQPQAKSTKKDDDSDSEEDMPLARIKSKASRSSLAVGACQSGLRPATIHSESPKPTKMSPPISSSPTSFARRASVPNVVAFPTESILGQKLWDASPASSQSGLTGDSSSVQPITPSDREMDGKISRDGSFPPVPMYHTAIRPEFAERPPSVMSSASNMDDATRMKEMWQAQYMAAAHKAFEEEWERQSNVSGSVAPSVQSYSPYTPQPPPQHQQHQHQQHQMPMPMPMPMGYNYPPQFQMYPPQHPGHHHQQQMPWAPPDHGQSMYAYGPTTQSVYGGEFGPPSAHSSPYRPMSMMGGFPASYSATNLNQYSPQPQPQQIPTSHSSYFNTPPPQHQYTRSTSSNDLTPPKKGLINQIPSNSPKGVNNRRSQLGISVINADDREARERGGVERERERNERPGQMQPPTSWRRSTTVPVMDREDQSAPRRKRQSSYLVN